MALKRLRWREFRSFTRRLALVAFADFIAFYVVTLVVGGDGLSGTEQAGHYFVSNHGRLTEVSHAAWLFTRLQALSLFVLIPLALISMAVDSLRAPDPSAEDADHSILGRKDAPPRRAPPRKRSR
ncbi:MAG TPA: hypothetical protein VLW85_02320 [Myxococcales bacterium]|nr:hypothetical protein [Myxococcales bacterium]